MSTFSISERDLRPGCRVMDVAGELDLAVADRLRSAIDAVSAHTGTVVINLKRCEFIDSTGLAVILAAHKEFEESGRRLVVCAPGLQVARILSITGLKDNGLVFDDVDDAAAG